MILCYLYDRCQGFPDVCEICVHSPELSEDNQKTDNYFWSCAYSCCHRCTHNSDIYYCDSCCPSHYHDVLEVDHDG